jgi:tRNA nucleotidyltransferase (CCA-adding enzyme)
MEKLIDSFRKFAMAEGSLLHRSFMVGGSVRDILLTGQKPKDVDIAIAGDAIKTARRFAGALPGASFVLLDRRFGAARVVRGGEHIDFARIRGRGIEEDLGKRDLTMNAMAVAMDRGVGMRPGRRLIDPFGGSGDLSKRVIRIVAEAL